MLPEPEVIDRLLQIADISFDSRELEPMRGGLESAVFRLTVIAGAKQSRRVLVVKRVCGRAAREVVVYRNLIATFGAEAPVPALFAVVHDRSDHYLLLELVRPHARWPWHDTASLSAVLERLATLHRHPLPLVDDEWDYEEELRASAASLASTARQLASAVPELHLSRHFATIERFASSLPEARERLFSVGGRTTIHGDVHSGNIFLRRRRGRDEPVILDWGRSRLGSPFEDVASWLQSMRPWESEAMRRHDFLLTAYLAMRGGTSRLTPEIRRAYWIAAASNVAAGSLRYHILSAASSSEKERGLAIRQATDGLRILRRAVALARG